MTTPTARVLALLEILQSGGLRTVPDLAAPSTSMSAPSAATSATCGARRARRLGTGPYGGYQLAPGYRMPPLMLTDDEALAVLLGLLAGGAPGWSPRPRRRARAPRRNCGASSPGAWGSGWTPLLETTGFTDAARPRATRAAGPRTRSAGTGTETSAGTETGAGTATGGGYGYGGGPHRAGGGGAARTRRGRPPATAGGATYRDRKGRTGDRTVLPYGLVAHSGRWALTGAGHARRRGAHLPAGPDRRA